MERGPVIRKIELFMAPIRLRNPFIISLGEMHFAENIFVRITTSDGITGFGECSPFASINGETMDTCMAVGRLLAQQLIGKNPLDTKRCSDIMDISIYGNTSIKSSLSIALWDIAAKHGEIPLYVMLGGEQGKQITTDYTVSIGSPERMAEDAAKIAGNGFGIIKIKVGKEGRTDIERIASIRKRVGDEITLRIDANQGWEMREAEETLPGLAGFNIQFCEEPVSRHNYMNLPGLRSKSPVKIMADESCLDHHDAGRLIGISACDYLNIKLGKSSGFEKALKIIEIADRHGIKMQTGGFLESRLGFTATAHLALRSNNIVFFDLDSPLMMEEDPVLGGIRYSDGGVVTLPEGPGLGAEVDGSFLKKCQGLVVC